MKRFSAILFAACVALSGCGHSNNAADASDSGDAAYTGLPQKYPRATPANLPATPGKPTTPAPSVAVTPPPSPPPAENSVATTPPSPPETPSLPAPAPAATDTTATPAPMDTTPPTPPIATIPPRPMDESEARRQVVVLTTSLGNIVIELDDVAAPRTCGNFRKLASSGFYNHTLFHRVIPNFIIQGGDPNSKSDDRRTYGLGDPGYTLPAEIKRKPVAGAVAMARLPDASNPQRDSNGCQFFICVADCPSLDGKYTVFGHVIRGMDTANKIANQPRDKSDDPVDRIEMQVSLETKQQALEENSR